MIITAVRYPYKGRPGGLAHLSHNVSKGLYIAVS